jgi:hypothetical protein
VRGAGGGGTVFNNSEVEPFVAANPSPTKAGNLIAVWQQDRWSNGGAHALMAAASFDGGMTWGSQTALPFNMCAPGGLSYERASDPWVVNRLRARRYFSKTTDGGVTWSPSKIIVPMRQRQQSIANVAVVAPNGTLYDFFTLITGTGPNTGPNSTAPHGPAIAFVKSTDAVTRGRAADRAADGHADGDRPQHGAAAADGRL